VTPAIISITPDPIAFSFGPINIGWYGIAYVVALGVLLWVSQRQAVKRGYDPAHIGNAFLIVLPLAIIGGRLYHVIDQWGPIYSHDLLRIFLPPYAGLGLYGGVLGAAIGILIYTRWKKISLPIALDVVIPGALLAQGIARWGNFFNQELYGPPTNLPWGIAIECQYRIAPWFCPGDPRLPAGAASYPFETTGFHPLFFYESALDILGAAIALFIVARFLPRLRPFDIAAFWAIWYGSTRAVLESFRAGWDWTLGGIPTAQWIGLVLVIVGVVAIAWNHRRGSQPYPWPAPWVPPPVTSPAPEDEADYYAPGEGGADDDETDDADAAEQADGDEGQDEAPTQPRAGPATAGDLG
jgi:phosphatidylglycerol:prolipoprotein diacylglycerol transferase